MRTFRSVNWFRLFIVVGLSLCTSAAMFFGDEVYTRGEIFNSILQASIAGFAFLQCPEDASNVNTRTRRGEKHES